MPFEMIMGQDHEWWLYDNDTDLYYPTGLSWNRVSEDEAIEIITREGTSGDWLSLDDIDL